MTMNRKMTIREIGRRTRLKNRDVQVMLETLIEVWTEELVRGGRVEIENLFVLEIKTIERKSQRWLRLVMKVSKQLRSKLNNYPPEGR